MIQNISTMQARVNPRAKLSTEESSDSKSKGLAAEGGLPSDQVDFSAAMLQQAAMLQAQPAQKPVGSGIGVAQVSTTVDGDTSIASRLPETERAAASLGAGGQISAGRPWSKDWVYRPGDDRNLDLKPLFGESIAEANPMLKLAQLVAAARSKAEAQEGSPAAGLPSAAAAKAAAAKDLGKKIDAPGASSATSASGATDSVVLPAVFRSENFETASRIPASTLIREATQAGREVSEQAFLSSQGILEASGAALASAFGVGGAVEGKSQASDRAHASKSSLPSGSWSGSDFLETLQGVRNSQLGQTKPVNSGVQLGDALSAPKLRGQDAESLEQELGSEVLSPFDSSLASAVLSQPTAARNSSAEAGVIATMNGQVTQNGAQQNRLSSQSVRDLSSQIRLVSQNPAGGEMRIRLNPGNLGELHVKISTQGNQVGLKIQASDERARRIIEESLGSLKEGLASQRLQLVQTDVAVGQGLAGGLGQLDESLRQNLSQNQQGSQQGQQAWNQAMGNFDQTGGFRERGQRSGSQDSSEGSVSGIPPRPMANLAGRSISSSLNRLSNGRVDIRA